MIVTRFTSFTENFVICSYQVTKNVPLWARLYQHVFCKKPSYFLSSSRYRNLGPSESACRHYAYPNPVPLLLATPLDNSWEGLAVSRSLGAGFPRGSEGLNSSTKFSLNSCSQSGNSCKRSLCTSSRPSFLFCVFGFCRFHATGFPVAPHSCFHFFLGTGFSVYLFDIKYGILWWRWWQSRCGRCRGTRR